MTSAGCRRVAATIAVHNFCLWLHEQLGRLRLAFTDVVDWYVHAISHQTFTRAPGVGVASSSTLPDTAPDCRWR
jgi:hypothetical protein